MIQNIESSGGVKLSRNSWDESSSFHLSPRLAVNCSHGKQKTVQGNVNTVF